MALNARGPDVGRLKVAVAIDRDRPALAVPGLVTEVGVGLEALEVREHVVEAPPRVSESFPSVVVGGGPTNREPRHRRRAADQPASPQVFDDATFVGLRLEPPIEISRHTPAVADAVRHVGPEIGPRLDEQHGPGGRLSQAGGNDAPCCPASHHDDFERFRSGYGAPPDTRG